MTSTGRRAEAHASTGGGTYSCHDFWVAMTENGWTPGPQKSTKRLPSSSVMYAPSAEAMKGIPSYGTKGANRAIDAPRHEGLGAFQKSVTALGRNGHGLSPYLQARLTLRLRRFVGGRFADSLRSVRGGIRLRVLNAFTVLDLFFFFTRRVARPTTWVFLSRLMRRTPLVFRFTGLTECVWERMITPLSVTSRNWSSHLRPSSHR